MISLWKISSNIHYLVAVICYQQMREHEVLPSGALLEDSLAIKDMDFLFSLVHCFKTIHLSLTKIGTLCLLNKHQLKDI